MIYHHYPYDEIAETLFFPVYDLITEDVMTHTGMTSGQLVDLGCGGGHFGLTMLKKTTLRGAFVDLNPDAVEATKQRAAGWNLLSRVTATVQDVHHLNFLDGFADLIISRNSMGFWSDQRRAFQEIWRILAPDGKTYIGSGMGNSTLRKQIEIQMKARDPQWPENRNRSSHSLSTDEYHTLLSSLNIPHQIIHTEEKGRWIVLMKPKDEKVVINDE